MRRHWIMKLVSRIMYGIISKSGIKVVGRDNFRCFKKLIALRVVNVSGWTERGDVLQVLGIFKIVTKGTDSRFSNRIRFFEFLVWNSGCRRRRKRCALFRWRRGGDAVPGGGGRLTGGLGVKRGRDGRRLWFQRVTYREMSWPTETRAVSIIEISNYLKNLCWGSKRVKIGVSGTRERVVVTDAEVPVTRRRPKPETCACETIFDNTIFVLSQTTANGLESKRTTEA